MNGVRDFTNNSGSQSLRTIHSFTDSQGKPAFAITALYVYFVGEDFAVEGVLRVRSKLALRSSIQESLAVL